MRLHISLKWFLLLCVALAILAAYVGKPWFDQRQAAAKLSREQLAVEQLMTMGATVEAADNSIVKVELNQPLKEPKRLMVLRDLTNLEQLHLFQGADDKLVHALKGLDELRELQLHGPGITNDALLTIGKLHRLKSLSLAGTRIDDDGLAQLRCLENLHRLDLSSTPIRGAGLHHLAQCPALDTLSLARTGIDDKDLAPVGTLAHLRELDLSETVVQGSGLGHLAKCRRLERLSLDKTTLSDLSGLAALDRIRQMRFFHVHMPPAEMKHFAGMERLISVAFHGPMFTDQHLAELASADQILGLELWGAAVTEGGLAQVRSMDRLQTINSFDLGDEEAKRLSDKLPKVTIILGTRRDGRIYGPLEP